MNPLGSSQSGTPILPIVATAAGGACGASRKRRAPLVISLIVLAAGILPLPGHLVFADSAPQCPPGDSIQQAGSNQCAAPDDPKADPIHLYIPDGQLRSSPVRLFVNRNISMSDKPMLCLYSGHALTTKKAAEDRPQPIDFAAPGQSWTENVEGQDVAKSGTVILANASGFPIDWYKPIKRVLAVVLWESGGKRLCAVAQAPVNLGNPTIAWIWTIIVSVIVLSCIIALASSRQGSAVRLLCADDGHLSLALTQIAAWTIAVGAVTFFYGLIRFAVPVIPNSILILMGLSLATAGLGTAAPPQTAGSGAAPGQPPLAAPVAGPPPAPPVAAPPTPDAPAAAPVSPKLSDLITLFPKDGSAQPSLSRAQMLFWTVLIIVLFVSKSAIDGVLWDVPSGLVALMGFSQAGYVGPKFLGPYAGTR